MNFKLSKYIIPSVISMVLVGTYTNIDGLFIGNVTGDAGLAAINFVWPIVAFITSLGTGIGIGGSVLLNKFRGSGEDTRAEEIKTSIIILLITLGLLSGLVFKFTYEPLLVLMGAADDALVFEYAKAYANVISIGAVFQVVGSGLVALLRNENKTWFSMICCTLGLAVHLVLDALLVKKYTLSGVAISTVASQALIMILAFFAIAKGKPKKPKTKDTLPILKASIAPLGINFVPSLVLLFTNFFAMKVGGTPAVTAYTVMSYAVYTFDYAFQGVCDGVQPVISYCQGSGDVKAERRAVNSGAKILFIMSLAFIAVTPVLIAVLPRVFGAGAEAEKIMFAGFIIYAASYPFKAAVKYFGSYFYAKGKTLSSNLLIFADPIVLTPILLVALPPLFKINGIWLSLTLAQIILTVPGAILFIRDRKKC